MSEQGSRKQWAGSFMPESGSISPDAGIVNPNPPRFEWFPPQPSTRMIGAWSRREALADVLRRIDQIESGGRDADSPDARMVTGAIRAEIDQLWRKTDAEFRKLALEYAESALRSANLGAIFGLPDIRY